MKRTTILTALVLLLSVTAVWSAFLMWDSTKFTMEERKWQPAPTGHLAGKDNGTGGPGHHPTDDCGICHGSNGVASDRVFTLTATVYESRAARLPVEGAEIIFQDYEGNVFSMTSNELGMMWSEAEMSADANMEVPPPPSNAWRYKAWVVEGGGERPMMTMPSVGGMMVPRMSCNMHHVTSGTLGGLWSRPASTLRSYPETGLSYGKHIFPILRTKCGPCHIPGPTRADQGGELFDYGAGLDLLTYGGSSVELDGVFYNKFGVLDVVNTVQPEASLMLAKTVAGASHGGGVFWTADDPDFQALLQWIAEGAQDN